MKGYFKTILDLEKHLLPPNINLFWHDKKLEVEIANILKDLKALMASKEELAEEKQQKLEQLHSILSNIYSDYKQNKPVADWSSDKINEYLMRVASDFKERYRLVNSNPNLRRLYKKFGCELLYGRRTDVEGENYDLDGPAVIITTHHRETEPYILETLAAKHIFWVADPYFHIRELKFRWWDLFLMKKIMKKIGVLEIDRQNPSSLLRKLLTECLHILESGGLIGMVPLGQSPPDYLKGRVFKMGHSGCIGIVQYAERNIGKKIPIIPVGIREEKGRYIVRIGGKIFLPDKIDDKKQYADKLIKYIESLVRV